MMEVATWNWTLLFDLIETQQTSCMFGNVISCSLLCSPGQEDVQHGRHRVQYVMLSEIHPSQTLPPLPRSTSPSCFPSWPVKLYSALITCATLPPSFVAPYSPSFLSPSLSAGETLLWAKFSAGVIQYSSLHFPHLSPSLSPSVYLSMPHHIPQFLQCLSLSRSVPPVVFQSLKDIWRGGINW